MNIAITKNDIILIARLNEVPNKDLVAYDARHYRGKARLLDYLRDISDININQISVIIIF